MCRNGRFTERGITGRHGYAAEVWAVLVTGAGPIGLLAALLGVQLTDRLGAAYHSGEVADVVSKLRSDIVIEATGAAWLAGLLTRRVPLTGWRDAYESHPEEVKVVLDLRAS